MYYIGNIGIGILISLLIFLNGFLSKYVGNFTALFLVHLIGFITIGVFKLFDKTQKKSYPKEFYFYLGGLFNILTFFSQNITMKNIGVSSTIIFIIVGQMMSSIIFDSFGLFGRDVHKLEKKKTMGFLIILFGAILINIG